MSLVVVGLEPPKIDYLQFLCFSQDPLEDDPGAPALLVVGNEILRVLR